MHHYTFRYAKFNKNKRAVTGIKHSTNITATETAVEPTVESGAASGAVADGASGLDGTSEEGSSGRKRASPVAPLPGTYCLLFVYKLLCTVFRLVHNTQARKSTKVTFPLYCITHPAQA